MAAVVTERDEVMLRWIAKWKGVTAVEVAAWVLPGEQWGVSIVERRFRALREHGLLESRPVLAGMRAVHWITREGLAFLGQTGSVQQPSVGQLRHDLAVVRCATWVQQVSGHQIVSERQIRASDVSTGEATEWRYAVRPVSLKPSTSDSSRRMIFPDFVSVDDAGKVFAHEVERTGKHTARIADLMWSYVNAEHIHRVRYYAGPKIITRYETTAKDINGRAHINDKPRKVFVAGWKWEDV